MSAVLERVGWDDDPAVASWPGLPPLPGDLTADACVVGLGASGLAAVEALAARGLSVVGVDAGRVAAGAAGRNGGFLLGGAALFLHDAIASWGQDAAVALYRATLAELSTLADRVPVRRVGSVRLASDDAEAADCAAHAAALRAHGIAVLPYEGPLGCGLFLPDDAAVNPAVRTLTLARQSPGRLFERTVVRAVRPGQVETALGVVSAPVVVVALDGRLDALLPELAGRVRTVRLQMLATAPVPPRLPCPVYCRWGYDYAQQDAAGRLFVGGGRDRDAAAEETSSSTPTAPVQEWIEGVATRLAGTPVSVEARWAASAGYTPDARPLVVAVDDGVVACGGYSGHGNLVGPLAARAAVALACDGTAPPSWASS